MTDKHITDLRTHRVARIAEASEPLGPHPKMGYGEAFYIMYKDLPLFVWLKKHSIDQLALFLLVTVGPFSAALLLYWVYSMIESAPISLP